MKYIIFLHNIPEGITIEGFFYCQFSGVVEPISAMLGAVAVIFLEPLLPFPLNFTAVAMIFVVAAIVVLGS